MTNEELTVGQLRLRADLAEWVSANVPWIESKLERRAQLEIKRLDAQIERLTAQLAEARQAERAAVVGYLRSEPTKNWTWKALANAIEAGGHMQKEGVLPDE